MIDITEEEIEGFYQDRRSKGLKNLTLKHYNSVLRPALRKAYKDKLIPDNPFDFIESMKREKAQISFYDKNEMKKLFEAMRGHKLEMPFSIFSRIKMANRLFNS